MGYESALSVCEGSFAVSFSRLIDQVLAVSIHSHACLVWVSLPQELSDFLVPAVIDGAIRCCCCMLLHESFCSVTTCS